MIGSCCVRYFDLGDSVCPVCLNQLDEHRKERDLAREFRASVGEMKPAARKLLERGALDAAEVASPSVTVTGMARRNPARRQLFKLIGVYLPEAEARRALQNIHEFKWIEAEKAGFDIWQIAPARQPLHEAARAWSARHLQGFLLWQNKAA